MKFSMSLVALVASTYAAPLPATSSIPGLEQGAAELEQLGSELSSGLEKAAQPLASSLPVPDNGAGLDKRQSTGLPNFFDAGSLVQKLEQPLQVLDGASDPSKRDIPLTSSVEPVLAPIESLTHSLSIAGRSEEDDCEEEGQQQAPRPVPVGSPKVTPTPVSPPPPVATPAGPVPPTATPVNLPADLNPALNPLIETPPSITPVPAAEDGSFNHNTSPSEPTGVEPCEEEAH